MPPEPARPTATESTLTLLEQLRQTHDASQQLAIAMEIRALAPAVIAERDAELTRILTENAALRAALERLVQAADRLATEKYYSIPSFACGVELAAARAVLNAATAAGCASR